MDRPYGSGGLWILSLFSCALLACASWMMTQLGALQLAWIYGIGAIAIGTQPLWMSLFDD